ncbi:HD domain-containing protein [Clostridium chauvoei]|uniref:HD domain-containing protein n=2 Tax=Clostridium chauvoei TaxID=46867 RepID=A0ABD4REW3_9CLOT|nr:HD domain-containing protein [Clostridium chauvoei]ATD55279.1 hypothetical protein BTM20_08515 [Clostridium chauvoei]ATD57048.1 hypothetical protein BTM21_04525 [Clostridium chauvoei]MBX7279630.1 HD domain-containing protein [Clostridium chauvoei]MBX7281999.1 HD domain-containing protein [Clostridium chauvoei]MBX7284412.1 HD domain-containing protein [Clostridium chauvoei]
MSDKKVFYEIDKVLTSKGEPSKFLNEIRVKKEFRESKFDILNKLENIEQEKKFHPEGNVWNHTCMVTDKGAELYKFAEDSRSFIWATLLHDVGKVTNTKWIRGRWRSYDHDTAGANIVKDLLKSVSEDKVFNSKVEELVRFHMHHIYIDKNLPFGNIEALINTNRVRDIILIFTCDKLGRGNQSTKDKEKIFFELTSILDKIEGKAKKEYKDIRDMLLKIKEKECSFK